MPADPSNDPFLTGEGRRAAAPALPPRAAMSGLPSGMPARSQSNLKAPMPPQTVAFHLIFSAPLGLYVVTAIVFALFWQVTVVVLAELFLAFTACNYVTSGFKAGMSKSVTRMLPVVASFIGVVAGALTGLYAHEAYVGPFLAIALGREYSNVLASSPAAAYADAGKIIFADTSKVDFTSAIGYRDGFTLCVAPVIDSGPEQVRKIGFWAVGTDCCEAARGDFRCGAAGTKGAKGGVRVASDGLLQRSHASYLDAIRQAAAANDLAVEDDPVLVRWVEDPSGEQRITVLRALGVLALGAAFFALLVFTVVVANTLASSPSSHAADARLPY